MMKQPRLDAEAIDYYNKVLSEEEICTKLIKSRTNVETEVNCNLALLVKPLKKVFPQAKIILVTMDGRACVNMWLEWKLYSSKRKVLFKELNIELFRKCCHLWAATNEFAKQHAETVKLEEMLKVKYDRVKWSYEEEVTFRKICGRLMREFDYV